MKMSELNNLIRTIVKEEISTSIPTILLEMAKALDGTKTVIKEEVRPTNTYSKQQPARHVPPTKKMYTKNQALNEILNQTEGGIPDDGPPAYMAGGIPMTDEPMVEDSGESVDIFSKDYSSFLKKVDAKARANRPA